MNTLKQLLHKCAGMVSICALLAPSVAVAAPKPLDPETVHAKIAKRGVGNWIYVEERNGVALVGRITSIDDQSFGLQLHNYPEITPVLYSDVIQVRTGLSRTGVSVLIGATVGAAIITGVVLHHEYEANKPQLPTMPSSPLFP
jgi:hypothetical protein